MKHRLLLTVDADKDSWNTVNSIARACKGCVESGDEIILFHVLPRPPVYSASQLSATPLVAASAKFERETKVAAEQMLEGMKRCLVSAGVSADRVKTQIGRKRGGIVPQILQAAKRYKCDAIVVGRRSKSMLGKFFLGSVAEQLLRNPTGFAIWVVE